MTIPTGLMALYRTSANPVALADRAQRRAGSYAASIRTRLACPQIVQGRPGFGTARRIRRTYAPSSCCTRRMAESDPKLCHGSRAAGARSQLSAFRLSRCCASVSASRARLRVTDVKTPFGPDTTGINPPQGPARTCQAIKCLAKLRLRQVSGGGQQAVAELAADRRAGLCNVLGCRAQSIQPGHFVHGIESGAADVGHKGEILLSDLHRYVERVVTGHTPKFFARNASGDPLISLSPGTVAALLDSGVLADLESEQWHRRLGAVRILVGISRHGKPRERQAALAALTSRRILERDIDVLPAIDDALRQGDADTQEKDIGHKDTTTSGNDYFSNSSRQRLLRGANKLANAIRVTLGPRGRTVVIGRPGASPRPTKKGSLIARGIELSDRFENLGAQIIRDVAERTDDRVGDGTTTAIVLAQAIVQASDKVLTTGISPVQLKEGLDNAIVAVVEELRKQTKQVTPTEIAQIATIFANGESAIGGLVSRAMEKVKGGPIIVAEGTGIGTELDIVEGIQFDRGYISPHFITNAEKKIAELDRPYILISEKKLSGLQPILPLLELIVQSGRPLLIIAEDVEGEALSTLVVNKLRGGLKVAAVKAPGFGDRRRAMLEDIAILTGGTVISEDLGIKLEKVSLNELGRAEKVQIERQTTIVVDGAGKKHDIRDRCLPDTVLNGGLRAPHFRTGLLDSLMPVFCSAQPHRPRSGRCYCGGAGAVGFAPSPTPEPCAISVSRSRAGRYRHQSTTGQSWGQPSHVRGSIIEQPAITGASCG